MLFFRSIFFSSSFDRCVLFYWRQNLYDIPMLICMTGVIYFYLSWSWSSWEIFSLRSNIVLFSISCLNSECDEYNWNDNLYESNPKPNALQSHMNQLMLSVANSYSIVYFELWWDIFFSMFTLNAVCVCTHVYAKQKSIHKKIWTMNMNICPFLAWLNANCIFLCLICVLSLCSCLCIRNTHICSLETVSYWQ